MGCDAEVGCWGVVEIRGCRLGMLDKVEWFDQVVSFSGSSWKRGYEYFDVVHRFYIPLRRNADLLPQLRMSN